MPLSIPLSVLDLAPIVEGGSASQAFSQSVALAQHVESLGYRRFWLAEHHGMAGVASAATAVVIAHVAAATSTIRVGAGGVMLPNHAPLVIAEQFGTLAAMHPGRIDLGVGRAPGTDPLTSQALRRSHTAADTFPQDVQELMHWFREPVEGQRVRAVPGAGQDVPVWILGSSLFGASLAAALGLPFAFASHFAPALLDEALETYRRGFTPSERLEKPYAMVLANVFAAPTVEEAQLLLTSLQQAFVNLRRGRPGPLPPPRAGFPLELPALERLQLEQMLSATIVGDANAVSAGLKALAARTGANEIMLACQMFDHEARLRSFSIAAAARTVPQG